MSLACKHHDFVKLKCFIKENLLVHSLTKKVLIFTSSSSINFGLGIGK